MEDEMEAWGARYCVYQEEVGKKGTHHLQGYIEMPKPVRWSHFKTPLERAHFEPAKGTSQECTDYCTKEDTRVGGPYIFGKPSGGSGERTDILALRDAIKDGKRGRELFDADGTCGPAVKYARGVGEMVAAYTPKLPRDDVVVTFHFGPPGTGKTHCCMSDDAYMFDGDANGFWNGYNGESKVIFDEFGGHCLKPLALQRVLDKYPYCCNVKGGNIWFRGTDIHICSNYLPTSWWGEKTKFNDEAISRRISVVHWHYEYKKYRLYKSDTPGQFEECAMVKFMRAYMAHQFVNNNVHVNK